MENKDAENGGILNFTAKHYRKIVEIILWVNLVFWVILGGKLGSHSSNNDANVFLGIILGFFIGLFINAIIGGSVATFLNIAEDVKNMNKLFNIAEDIKNMNKLLPSQHNETRRKNKAITEKGSFTDIRDGKVYKTVKIGNRTWMAENLNYEAESSKCYYNDPANGQKYGRLYDWETAKRACPPGWHLPSDAEWQELVDFAGGKEVAGTELKSASGWDSNGNGTDDYGFSALPGGDGGSSGSFDSVGYNGFWWSATENNAASAWYRRMYYNNAYVSRDDNGKTRFISVRCVQD
jgi:uncharacterized protein (TIGR02145 family)